MNAKLAADILGIGRVRWEVCNMVRALGMHAWNNTAEENARRAAGAWVLRHWRAYAAECNARRDALFNTRRRQRAS